MAVVQLDGYYDRTDPSKGYVEHLFRAGYVLQSAELNEIQSNSRNRIRGISDALFKDGDLIRDARVVVNPDTGATTCEGGAIYIAGMVRGVAPASFSISVTGMVYVGVYLKQSVVTELEDPALRDPATGVRNYQEAGAARLREEIVWGFQGDGQDGEFYPVYSVEDGNVLSKEAPPQLDSVSQAIAQYDRDSSGGTYVVSGFSVVDMGDDANDNQVYTVMEGRARVAGHAVDYPTSKRVVYDAEPDLLAINAEPHVSTSIGEQRVEFNLKPAKRITELTITAQKTVSVVHGAFTGAADALPDNTVLEILTVVQGTTTYVQGTDYRLVSGLVDWSLTGAEPAAGSTYSVTYRYIATVTPTNVDVNGFTVTGAVVGTAILVDYDYMMPRIDRLCLNADGQFVWIKGSSSLYTPALPSVPTGLLPISRVVQFWDDRKTVTDDGIRMVPMSDIAGINAKLDGIMQLLARQALVQDITTREASAKKGVFTDSFADNSQRDAGIAQTGAIFDGVLTLPIDASVATPSNDITGVASVPFTLVSTLEQTARSAGMKINPYMAIDIQPAKVSLSPAVDRWSETVITNANEVTQIFNTSRTVTVWGGSGSTVSVDTSVNSFVRVLSTNTSRAQLARQIDVSFRIEGFGSGEVLSSVIFDGITVPVSA